MENFSADYKTYTLGSVSSMNDCTRIMLFYSGEVGAVSLHNLEDIVRNQSSKGKLIISSLSTTGDEKIFKYQGTESWGFDIIIYLSLNSEPVGYTKYITRQGVGNKIFNISFTFTSRLNQIILSPGIDTTLSVSASSESEKYKSQIVSWDEIKEGSSFSPYSTHISSLATLFLGDYSIIQQDEKPVRLNILSGFYLNEYGTTYDRYFIGYYDDDIALFAWDSDERFEIGHYCIMSLTKTDDYGHPIYYSITKEGRRPEPLYPDITPPEATVSIKYISGRYLACEKDGSAGEIELYDTLRKEWLSSDGAGYMVSNPRVPGNKIYRLKTQASLFSDLVDEIPELIDVYLTGEDKTRILNIYQIIGKCVVFRNTEAGEYSYTIATPVSQIYLMESEYPKTIFLNDTSIIVDDMLYAGVGKIFSTPGYNKIREAKEAGEKLDPSKYRRNSPKFTKPDNIIAGFEGLLFYKDDKNIIKYL